MADANTVVRAVTLPVGSPVGRSWEELRAALAGCWRLSTHAANWCVQQLYRRDTVGAEATPDAVKQGQAAKGRFYAYGEAAKEPWFGDWAGAKQSLNICLQYAHRKYLAERHEVMVRHRQGLLSVRHPYPYPVDADGWRPGYTAEAGKPSGSAFPTVALTLPGGEAFTLRLKRGPEFGRQLARFRELASGAAKKGEAALYRNSKGDVLVKLVGHFPRRERATEATHAMLVRTDPAAFLVAEIDGQRPWVVNGDHFRRWQAAHRAYRQRVAEDAKREKRMDPVSRAGLNKSREIRCEKHRHRLDTAVHAVTAQVVRYAARQRVGCVVFDDSVRTYLPDGFPWHLLGERLRYKLDGAGVALVAADTADPEEYAGWLADRSLTRAVALAGRRLLAGVNRKGSHPAVTTPSRPRKTPSGNSRTSGRRSRSASGSTSSPSGRSSGPSGATG